MSATQMGAECPFSKRTVSERAGQGLGRSPAALAAGLAKGRLITQLFSNFQSRLAVAWSFQARRVTHTDGSG